MKKVFAFLPKPNGCFAVFTGNDDGSYEFRFFSDIPEGYNNNIRVKVFAKDLFECRNEEDELISIIVRPDNRPYDNLKTITKTAYNVATVKAILDLQSFRTYWINRAKNWQGYFNLLDLLPDAGGNIKTAALMRAKEIAPGIEFHRSEEAECFLIGIYGIYEILKTTVGGIKDGRTRSE